MPGFHIITLGCPKNQVDSEVFAGACLQAGMRLEEDPDRADLVVLNTCAFISPAVEESMERLLELLDWKAAATGRKVVLAGCLPGRYRDDGSGGLEDIDLVIGPGDAHSLARWLGVEGFVPLQKGGGVSRFVKIAEGCSNRCSYCTIPGIRGGFRPVDPCIVLDSVSEAIRQGAREVGLVAQDTGAHPELHRILDDATRLNPDVWFRLYYVHPRHFPSWLPGLLESRRNLAPYLDLPIQHASAPVLERMGRGYGPGDIEGIMERVECLSMPVAVRFTLITGYPGETQQDFETLRDFLGRWPSLRHIAAFSWWPEEGTREFRRVRKTRDRVPEHVAMSRLSCLSSIGESIYHSWSEKLAELPFPVLADTPCTGHSIYDAPEADIQAVFTSPVREGSVHFCRPLEGSDGSMIVEPLP